MNTKTLAGTDDMLFGVAVNRNNFIEQRYIYTRKQLMEADKDFKKHPMGGYSGEKGEDVEYIVTKPLKSVDEIKDFLINRNGNILMCNKENPENFDDVSGCWKVEMGCFFTVKQTNPTMLDVMLKTGLKPSMLGGKDSRAEQFEEPDPLRDDPVGAMDAIYDTVEFACEETDYADMKVVANGKVFNARAEDVLDAIKNCKGMDDNFTLRTGKDKLGRDYKTSFPFKDVQGIYDIFGVSAYETKDMYTLRMDRVNDAAFDKAMAL